MVGQELASCLTGWTIICFIRRADDSLDWGSAPWTGLLEFSVGGHFGEEGGHLFRETGSCLLAEEVGEVV